MGYILAGFSGSDSSLQAVLHAREMSITSGARLQILTVARFPSMGLDAYMDNVMQEEIAHCEQLIESLKRRLGSNETTQLVLRVGNPAVEIVDQAREYGVGQIVLGARRYCFGRWPVSRVVRQIAVTAPCKVTVVRDRNGIRPLVLDEAVVREAGG